MSYFVVLRASDPNMGQGANFFGLYDSEEEANTRAAELEHDYSEVFVLEVQLGAAMVEYL